MHAFGGHPGVGGNKEITTGVAIPLLPQDKRRILGNFCNSLAYSRPAQNHFGFKKVCMRQRVACGACALVDWIENCFPCYLFAECPEKVKPKQGKGGDDCSSDDDASSEERDSEHDEVSARQRRGKLLRDAHGYYIFDAHTIDSLLDVRKYMESWPLIPAEELHASSVQHPSYPHFRWLLHTRRVHTQTVEQAPSTGAREPPCAGIGIKDKPVWMCKGCITALCRPEPIMPYKALANWNWGGRLHPLYKNLNATTKSLLGLATMISRMIVLQYSEHAEDQEKGSRNPSITSCRFVLPSDTSRALRPGHAMAGHEMILLSRCQCARVFLN